MKLTLNSILNLTKFDIENSKIELNMRDGSGGPLYIDKWLALDQSTKESGISDCSYWGWYGKQKNYRVGQLAFSFIKMSNEDWLFVSAAKIVDIPEFSRAKVEIVEKYRPFFGRLVIQYYKGNTYGRYVFNIRNVLDSCIVKEILPSQYNGEKFEGYDRVHLPYPKLSDIFKGKIMPTYYEALKKITGVYCLTDTKTGKLYIGSATGGDGVAGRWGNYLSSKHGNNKKLISLYDEKGPSYFEENFTFTILEYFGLSYDSSRITEREQYWKKCLNTIKNGYNDN